MSALVTPRQETDTVAAPAAKGGVAAPSWTPSVEFLRLIPRDFAREHLILSAGRGADGAERLIVAPASSPAAVFNTGVRLGVPITTHGAEPEAIARAIDGAYARAAPAGDTGDAGAGLAQRDAAGQDGVAALLAEADRDLLSTSGKGPIVKLVDAVLFEAQSRGASDVHVQPLEGVVLVRYRVDGVLHTVRELPPRVAAAVVSRIKVMGRMDIAERRLPQDGRATVTIGAGGAGRSIDLRISTLPTSHGERAVVRLLDTSGSERLCTLEGLGMPADIAARYLDRAGRSSGIVLVTGPTGSGKTTTLYATLTRLARTGRGELNVMTIEDPVEYNLSTPGVAVSQAQVNTKKGVTFATGLRHILRQDPDVVMVGEVRDEETARVAIQSSLTGHLVFSTLHTNDAAGAVTRLLDLGVEPYLVSAALSAVLAQRLARRVHGPCAGAGCGACLGSGFAGRVGVFELLTVDERVRHLIAHGGDLSEVRAAAVAGGMRSLLEEGGRLAALGVTTLVEVARVVQGAE